jgi:hypothetical protein
MIQTKNLKKYIALHVKLVRYNYEYRNQEYRKDDGKKVK